MAEAVSARGGRVAIGDLDADLAAAEAAKLPHDAVGLPLDVTDRDSFGRFLDQVESTLGPLDVLVNNAGIMVVEPFLEEPDALTRRQFDINVFGVITGMRLSVPRMLGRRAGHVVNIASAAGKVPVAGEAVYVATKHAVAGLSEAVRYELLGSGIEVSVIMPGLANTELASGMSAGRGVKLVEPHDVGLALVEALEQPRFEVFVPRSIDPLIRLSQLLPRAGRDFMNRLFETDRIATQVDRNARAAYAARASAGTPNLSPPPTTDVRAGAAAGGGGAEARGVAEMDGRDPDTGVGGGAGGEAPASLEREAS
jgi:short-subunit dehydrogenase